MYLDGGMGEEGGYLLLCFFSIIYILGLVCYKHTIHVGGPKLSEEEVAAPMARAGSIM